MPVTPSSRSGHRRLLVLAALAAVALVAIGFGRTTSVPGGAEVDSLAFVAAGQSVAAAPARRGGPLLELGQPTGSADRAPAAAPDEPSTPAAPVGTVAPARTTRSSELLRPAPSTEPVSTGARAPPAGSSAA